MLSLIYSIQTVVHIFGYDINPVTTVRVLDLTVEQREVAVGKAADLHIHNVLPLGHRLKGRRDQGNIRFFNQVIDQVLSIPFVVVCLTLAIRN